MRATPSSVLSRALDGQAHISARCPIFPPQLRAHYFLIAPRISSVSSFSSCPLFLGSSRSEIGQLRRGRIPIASRITTRFLDVGYLHPSDDWNCVQRDLYKGI